MSGGAARASGQPEPFERVDVVVLTALEIEYRSMRACLKAVCPVPEERGSRFEVGRAAGSDARVALHMTGPGNPGAAVLAERAIAHFQPEAVLFVGVGGGRKDVRLGDVVAADVVYDYDTGKDTADRFLPRQKTHPCSYRLVQLARAVAGRDDWQPVDAGPGQPRPRAHVKPIAAGGRVVAHHGSQVGRLLADSAGDAVAVDMEGYGFLVAAHANHAVDALVIRGISDLLGDKDEAHDERWQPVAARNAAAFAHRLIRELPLRSRDSSDSDVRDPVLRDAKPAAGLPSGGRLPVQELGRLADLLLAVPGLSAPYRWQQFLDELPFGTAVSRQSASRPEALALLRTCEDHAAWGHLRQVLQVVAPDSTAVARLGARMTQLGLR